MRNVLKKTILMISVVLVIVNSTQIFAVDESITITATVPAWAVIEPSTTAARIVLDGRLNAPEYNETLLTLNLSHNSSIGYALDIKSANNGRLVGIFDGSKSIPYKISYDSQAPISLTITSQNIGGAATSVTGSAVTPVSRNVSIIVSNADANLATQQDYEDTITFTLTGI